MRSLGLTAALFSSSSISVLLIGVTLCEAWFVEPRRFQHGVQSHARISKPKLLTVSALGDGGDSAAAVITVAPPSRRPDDIPSLLDTSFVSPECEQAGITEALCIDTARRMQRVNVPVPTSVHPDGTVGISYVHWPATIATSTTTTTVPPPPPKVVLVHGFDSSALEFRRLGSRLAAQGVDAYAVDLWGWGFTRFDSNNENTASAVTSTNGKNTKNMDFSASAKVVVLQSWIDTVVCPQNDDNNNEYFLAGASLGGAAAMKTAVLGNPSSAAESSVDTVSSRTTGTSSSPRGICQGLILIDAQGFVDGVGLMSALPSWLASRGVQILQSIPLRSAANDMSYANPKVYATDEAVAIGRLHCLRPGWNDAMVNFMNSGGFTPSRYVPQIAVPTLVLWGRQDTILNGETLAPKFGATITKATTTLQWIENCGHVPHLEQPDETSNAMAQFIQKCVAANSDSSSR